jgi:flagellar hook-associated protein 2
MADPNTIDPGSTATKLAGAYTAPARSLLATQANAANATSSALTKLQGGLSTFGTTLGTMSGKGGMAKMAATVSDDTVASATADAGATPASYGVFVEQVASNHQVAITDLPAKQANLAGKITLSLGNGEAFDVLLSSVDVDANGSLSYAEIARAINQANGNDNKVTAMVVTANGQQQLILNSQVSGKEGQISIDSSIEVDGGLRAALSAPPRQMSPARDAVVWLGPQGTGLKIEQSSNTLTAIEGVKLTLKKAQAPGSAPTLLTVSQDGAATKSSVQGFVDSYNALRSSLDALTSVGARAKDAPPKANTADGKPDADDSSKSGGAAGPFATDASVMALKDKLSGLLRQTYSGHSLRELGVSADRYGKLSLDASKLDEAMTRQPRILDDVFGKASLKENTGVLGAFNTVIGQWTDASKGFIKQRQESIQVQQKGIGAQQTKLDARYDQMYERYLKQFSALQDTQRQMSETSNQLGSIFNT